MTEDTKFIYTVDWKMIRGLTDAFLQQRCDKQNLVLAIAMIQGNAVHSAVGIVETTTGLHAIVGVSCPKCGTLEQALFKGGPEMGGNFGECPKCVGFLFNIVLQSISWSLVDNAVSINKTMLQPNELAHFQGDSIYSRSRLPAWLARLVEE
ncbi:hypothetical protein F506_17915 [Herbaspirillum hiltneri N3]|uniref:Uncharacterized protein n=1 Tax=Herbaspirillum hiltneri N3 TaxID=1262470 RepID=A0ABN4I5V6_9BURK|nr:hypothetical protein [Herbaspirillum hiltneri]AKZ64291.1 hypothetical protein F506_17915 [Herbaspirillum hiltneri N3]